MAGVTRTVTTKSAWRTFLLLVVANVALLARPAGVDGAVTATPVGDVIAGGPTVAISADGRRVAVGTPLGSPDSPGEVSVFEWDGTDWVLLGDPLVGQAAGDEFGGAVALSADGGRVAVGAQRHGPPGSDVGQVSVFDWDGASWLPTGASIDGSAASDYFGYDVEISASGDRLAVGAWPYARVFGWNGTAWTQIGDDFARSEGELALSADGERIAVGSVLDGIVRVFDRNGATWEPAGPPIVGTGSDVQLGGCVTMSADGDRIAMCVGVAPTVRVVDWNGSEWVPAGDDIPRPGIAFSLSGDGIRLAVGEPATSTTARVRIYSWDGENWLDPGSDLPSSGRDAAIATRAGRVVVGDEILDGGGIGTVSGATHVFDLAESVAATTTTPPPIATTTAPNETATTLPATGSSSTAVSLAGFVLCGGILLLLPARHARRRT